MVFKLPKLDYDYDALEPYIDEKTMKIHHLKHHKAYTDNLNRLVKGTELERKDINDILKDLKCIPNDIRTAVINNGGGYANHNFFWTVIGPDGGEPSEELSVSINSKFGSIEKFKEELSKAALTNFGSGWAWLVVDSGNLEIISTANQDSPLSEGKIPLLCIDVWEHAYYLKYENRRLDYIKEFFNVINWKQVSKNFIGVK